MAETQEQAVSRNAEQQARDSKCRTDGHQLFIVREGEVRILRCRRCCSMDGTLKVVPRTVALA